MKEVQFEKIAQMHAELNKLLEPIGCRASIVKVTEEKPGLKNLVAAIKRKKSAKKEKKEGAASPRGLSRSDAKRLYWKAIREISEQDGLTKAEAIATYRRRKIVGK